MREHLVLKSEYHHGLYGDHITYFIYHNKLKCDISKHHHKQEHAWEEAERNMSSGLYIFIALGHHFFYWFYRYNSCFWNIVTDCIWHLLNNIIYYKMRKTLLILALCGSTAAYGQHAHTPDTWRDQLELQNYLRAQYRVALSDSFLARLDKIYRRTRNPEVKEMADVMYTYIVTERAYAEVEICDYERRHNDTSMRRYFRGFAVKRNNVKSAK